MRREYMLLLLGLVLFAAGPANCKKLRGIDPALAPKYDRASGKFACLDGSKTLAFDKVNDNFCDCQDGSDEPGTSACYNGQFYCRNLGHVPKTISAVFVDDGVCDCCDGSDERLGCSNTCLEQAAAIRKALQTKLANYDAALEKKQQYIEQAKAKRAEMAERRSQIDQEIEDQKKLIVDLKEEKAKLDEEEAERKAAEEAAAAARKAEEEAAAALQQQAEQAAADAGKPAEAAAAPEAAAATQGEEQQSADATEEHHEETAEERGRRIAAQWTNDPDAALKAEAAVAEGETLPDEHDYLPDEHEHMEGADTGVVARTLGKARQLLDTAKEWAGSLLGRSAPTPPAGSESAAQQVQSRIWSEEGKLTSLEQERSKLDKQLVMDFGPQDMYLPLLDKCYDSDAVKYVYQVCMFDKAVQKEGYQETDIGKWGRFDAADGVTRMVYENGAYCWEGPNRSMTVTLECGLEEKLKDGGEPSKCVYSSTLETPAMCSLEERDKLTKKLQELEELERTIAQQIKDEL